MKSFLAHLLVLGFLFCAAVAIDSPADRGLHATILADSEAESADPWRRTAHGWERITDWTETPRPEIRPLANATTIHPGLLAILWVLIAIAALQLFPVSIAHVRQTGETLAVAPSRTATGT